MGIATGQVKWFATLTLEQTKSALFVTVLVLEVTNDIHSINKDVSPLRPHTLPLHCAGMGDNAEDDVNLFNRTPTGLTQSDVKAMETAMTAFFDALHDRLHGVDGAISVLAQEVLELQQEVEGLQKMPRQSLKQRLKNK